MTEMAAQLSYNLVPSDGNFHRLAIDVPNDSWDRVQTYDKQAWVIEILKRKASSAVIVEPGDESTRLLINDRRIGSSQMKPRLLRGVVQLINMLDAQIDKTNQDAKFQVQVSPDSINNTGRHMISMRLAWPETNDYDVQRFVTNMMVATAINLKYDTKRDIPRLVYAQVHRPAGVTLETNPLGSCSVGTDGMWYNPENPILELDAHNVYNHTQQFILLVGGVALARADTLVTG